MTTDFRFVPISGPLPGKSFAEQTEKAFNELGGRIEGQIAQIDNIEQIVKTAESTANQSLQTVQTAVDAANSAETSAAQAINTANQASAIGNAALTKSTELATNVALAISTANDSLGKSIESQMMAQDLSDQVREVKSAVTLASSQSEAAINISNIAMGVYSVAPTAELRTDNAVEPPVTTIMQFDADNYFGEPEKLCLVVDASDPALDLPPLNFPVELSPPLFFLVEINGDATLVSQSTWDVETGQIYRRIGLTDYSDPIPFTAWSNWATVGGNSAGGLYIGELRLLPFQPAEMPLGWYLANGDTYPLDSPQGQALSILSENYRTDWGISVVDDDINLPNLFSFDGRGFFPRAVDGLARLPGSVEEDAFRSHSHTYSCYSGNIGSGGNVIYAVHNNTVNRNTGAAGGTETRPLNVGLTPAIYLGV